MPLQAPDLDDRKFEDLLREARLRIPIYCPEWTDFNDSDPGMALVQLFAWFTEQMFWRLNQVPDRAYVQFLKLLNLELLPARPARAHVVFTPAAGSTAPVTVDGRSRFEVPGAAGGDVVVFETVRPLDLVPYPLDTVQVLDGVDYQDNSQANERGNERFRPFGWVPQRGNALYLGFRPAEGDLDEDTGKPIRPPQFPGRVVLRVFLPPAAARAGVSREGGRQAPPQRLVWEYRSRLDLAEGQAPEALDRWRPLTVLADETGAFTRDGDVELRGPGPDILAALGGRPTPDKKPRYWVRCRLAGGQFPRESVPEIASVRVNVVEVEALATFNDEVLGESDGFQRQYTLRHTPVVAATLALEVQGPGESVEVWQRTDDLAGSKADDPHFTVNPTSGLVQFGDGRNGRIPPPGGLVVARSYLSGGGAAGNVPAGAINSPPAGVSGVDRVTNPRPAVGGKDEEDLDKLKERAPLALRGDSRAVTEEDFRRFAAGVAGVAKADVLPLRHPDHPSLDVPGAVTVVVVPDQAPVGPDGEPLKPLPGQDLLDLVAAELDRLRPLGCEVFVTGPDYRDIAVQARVVPERNVTEAQVKAGVTRAIADYLAPTRRVPPPAATPAPAQPAAKKKTQPPVHPNGWPFGEPLYPSRLYQVILDAADERGTLLVSSVTRLRVSDRGVPVPPERLGDRISFAPGELPFGTASVELDSEHDPETEPRA